MNPQLFTVAQTGLDFASNALQNRYTKKQIELQNKLNVQQWNRQNAYNTPAAQMARFQEAGLNPNLIYGQGNAGNAGPAPTLEAPFRKAPHLDAVGRMSQIIAMQNAKAQNAYILGQIQLQQTQADAMQQKIDESRTRQTLMESQKVLYGAQRRFTLARGEALSYDNWVKYGSGDITANLDELYQYNRNALRLKNSILEAQLQNLGLDATLKGDVHTEKSYYNRLRGTLGIEKGDNFFIRGGASLLHRAQDYILKKPSFRNWREN